MASRRKRGPVAFRPRLSAGLALSLEIFIHPPNTQFQRNQVVSNRLSHAKKQSGLFARKRGSIGHQFHMLIA